MEIQDGVRKSWFNCCKPTSAYDDDVLADAPPSFKCLSCFSKPVVSGSCYFLGGLTAGHLVKMLLRQFVPQFWNSLGSLATGSPVMIVLALTGGILLTVSIDGTVINSQHLNDLKTFLCPAPEDTLDEEIALDQ